MRHRLPVDVLLLLTTLIWAFNFTANKYALLHGVEPLSYSSFRIGLAALMFSAFTVSREDSLRVRRSDAPLLIGAGLVGVWANQSSFIFALQKTTASTAALVFGTLPIFVALFSHLSRVERVRTRHWLATLVSFLGVALVALGARAGISGELGGILLALLGPITWGAYSVAVVPLMRRYSPYRISAVVLVAGGVPLVLTSIKTLLDQDWASLDVLVWGALLYGLLFSLVLTNVLWFTSIGRVGAARASLYANLNPFLGAIIAVFALSEHLGVIQIVGGVVIAAGIVIARTQRAPASVD